MPSTFDHYDSDSWFFGIMSRNDADELFESSKNEAGAFLVRESTTAKGDLVLVVKESDDKVSHYIIKTILPEKGQQVLFKIGEQIFLGIPNLLNFYKLNNLDETPLKVPAVPKEPMIHRRSFEDYLADVQVQAEINRNTQQASFLQRKLPGFAEVIQSRVPNAYDKTALTLRKGQIVKVTKVDINGCWEGESGGRKGHFPFNYVKFIEDSDERIKCFFS